MIVLDLSSIQLLVTHLLLAIDEMCDGVGYGGIGRAAGVYDWKMSVGI